VVVAIGGRRKVISNEVQEQKTIGLFDLSPLVLGINGSRERYKV
jgi:hypothetical protein